MSRPGATGAPEEPERQPESRPDPSMAPHPWADVGRSEPFGGRSEFPSPRDPGDPGAPGGAADDELRAPRQGPPGGRIFTLEGRRAPGLYLVAWVLSLGGLVLFFLVGPMASSGVAGQLLIGLGSVVLTVGLAAACGYQIVERADRHPERYRGPSPLLVFFTFFFALALVGLVAFVAGDMDPTSPFGFLVAGLLQAVAYAVVVWIFVVRSGALSWADMGWPTWQGSALRDILRAVGASIAIMLPATFGVLIFGGLLAMILGVEAPDVLPTPSDALEGLAVVLVASILAPVGEELFFRGFALTAWGRDLGARSAIIRSAIFFALIHIVNITSGTFSEGAAQALLQTAVILPLGFVLGWLFVRHGMAGAIGGHLTYNSLLLVLLVVATYLPGSELPAP